MNCHHCHSENIDGAKFCSNCGNELGSTQIESDVRVCSQCGHRNPHDARFCATCGTDMKHFSKHAHHQQQNRPKGDKRQRNSGLAQTRSGWNPLVVGVLILLAGIGYVALPYISGNPPEQRTARPVEAKSGDAKLEAQVAAIASWFICSCGSCGEQSLDVCTCGRATEERQYIRSLLQQGQRGEQIITALNTTYGWMKAESAARYDSVARAAGKSTKLAAEISSSRTRPLPRASVAGIARVVTAADRNDIYSQFKCPCGRCGIDELKDCSCDHPRGAKEVKQFIDERIQQGTLTIAQVTEAVQNKYGGKKKL